MEQTHTLTRRARLRHRYKTTLSDRHFRRTTLASVLFFVAGVAATSIANVYAAAHASNPVTDVILSNTRVYNVDDIVVYGAFTFFAFIAMLCVLHPKRIPFIFSSVGLFLFIRAFFMSLTHLGVYPYRTAIDFHSRLALAMFGGGDDFYSGHTGIPFLMALLFWDDPLLRNTCIIASAFAGAVVLLGHLHYTIDVASAFFITYAIYHLALKFFPKEYALFKRDETTEGI